MVESGGQAYPLWMYRRCQGYEGGFGGEPGNEAHGGYAFCAFAALVILGRHVDADLDALEVSIRYHWLLLWLLLWLI